MSPEQLFRIFVGTYTYRQTLPFAFSVVESRNRQFNNPVCACANMFGDVRTFSFISRYFVLTTHTQF